MDIGYGVIGISTRNVSTSYVCAVLLPSTRPAHILRPSDLKFSMSGKRV